MNTPLGGGGGGGWGWGQQYNLIDSLLLNIEGMLDKYNMWGAIIEMLSV